MSGGSVNKQSGFLSRATEIKTLTSELNDLSVKIKEVGDKKQQIENDMRTINNQLSSYVPLVRVVRGRETSLENTQKHLEEKIESGSNTEKNYKAELGQIEKQLSESSDDIAEAFAECQKS